MVPNGWGLKSLTEAGMTVTDGDRGKEYPNSSELFEEGYCLFLSAKNVTKKGFLFEETQFISKDKHEKLRKGTVKRGDIILTTRGTVGQTALYDESIKYDVIRINSGMATIGCNKSEILSNFFYAYTNSSLFKRQIESLTFGSAQPQLTLKIIKSLKVLIPPIPEQQKIANILTTWDKAIDTTERLIDNSKQQKKALMQQLLTGNKRLLDDNGKPFEGEWKSGYLEELCDFKGGSAFKEKYQGKSEGDLPFIKVSDMNIKGNEKFIIKSNNWIMHEDLAIMKVKSFPAGSVVFAKVGAALLLNRRRILVRDTIIDNNMMAAMPKDNCITSYLYYLMLAIDFAKLVQEGAVPSINQSDLGRFKIAYTPSHKEQQKIAAVLTNADKEIELLEQQLADLQQEKKALMQVLLTGKKRVRVDEIV